MNQERIMKAEELTQSEQGKKERGGRRKGGREKKGKKEKEGRKGGREKRGRKKKSEDSLRDLWNNIKRTNCQITGVP